MKVQLIVVQGKPEGKVIPLNSPVFKIGRGEGCHLRPNSELISREHVEIQVTEESVTIRDLGSRNGTIVNNKTLTGRYSAKNGDLLQVGPLTFAVSIVGIPADSSRPTSPAKPASLDDVGHDEIESWLVGEQDRPAPEHSGELYKGDTITVSAFKGTPKPAPTPAPKPASTPPPNAPVEAKAAPPEEPEIEEEVPPVEDSADVEDPRMEDDEDEEVAEEEFMDESNPFYMAKKKSQEADTKAAPKDSSEAANDILKRMLERRRASR